MHGLHGVDDCEEAAFPTFTAGRDTHSAIRKGAVEDLAWFSRLHEVSSQYHKGIGCSCTVDMSAVITILDREED